MLVVRIKPQKHLSNVKLQFGELTEESEIIHIMKIPLLAAAGLVSVIYSALFIFTLVVLPHSSILTGKSN